MAQPSIISVLSILQFYLYLVGADPAQCWYPDSKTLAPDIPCNDDGSPSACCNEDAWCLDNGLCLVAGVVSRGSCTDRNWNSDACASYCRDCNSVGGCVLYPCDPAESSWTCGSSCSSGNDNTFPMNGGNGIALRASQVEDLQTGSASVVTIQPTSQLQVEAGGGSGADNNSNSGRATQTADSSNGYTAGDMAGVGAGVGAPLLLALLAALFVIMRQRKRLQRSTSVAPVDEKRYTSAPAYAPSSTQSPGYNSYSSSNKPAERYPPYARQGHHGEMDSIAQVNEMDNAAQRQELPAGR